MTESRSARTPLALLAVALLAACDPILLPAAGGEVYVLEMDPAPVLENAAVRIEMLADTFWLHRDGSARRVSRERLDYAEHRDTTVTFEGPYRHTTRGGRVELESVCGPHQLCAPPPHLWGRITREGLELHAAPDPRPTLRYRRLPR